MNELSLILQNFDNIQANSHSRLDLTSQFPRRLLIGLDMGSEQGRQRWTVFDGVKTIPSTPEALMVEIDAAIIKLEYARATAVLESPALSSPSRSKIRSANSSGGSSPKYDARMADEAYRAGCAALAAGKLDEALPSLTVSLSKCPPDKTSAVAKLQSLISLTSQQLQKSSP